MRSSRASSRYPIFFGGGEKRGEKKQTIPGINGIGFQWPTVVDDEYKGLNGVQRVLDSETITRNAF